MIIDSQQGPPTDPVKTSMPVEVARKILGYARAGLPVIVVGTPPDRTPGNTPQADPTLKSVIAELLAEKTVSRVAHESDVPDKLRSLGIRPAVEPATPSPVLGIRRRDTATRTDYYFLYNQGIVSPPDEPSTLFEPATGEPLDREVGLEGRGRPYLLDAWSGKITPIVNYTVNGERITLRIRLSRDNGVLIAISEDPNRFGVPAPAVYVTKTSADGAAMDRNAIAIRASKAGTYTTTLSNGRTVRSEIRGVPAAIDLTKAKWHVSVEDWQPANPYDTTFGAAAAETRKARIEMDLDALKAWPEIPELQNVSGLGTYTTAVNLPAGWTSANGAVLSMGEVFDSFTLTVNGQVVSVDQLAAAADIGPYLKAGPNSIAVRVATTLNNRLAKIDEGVANRGLVQPYGLVGPVVLTPYSQATVWRSAGR
ncbi:MAG: hypothetical protein NTW28_31965 [Candidatus Solibacter sp.]|nr:hypothetical protein [Candidatus Solibacter sp.]